MRQTQQERTGTTRRKLIDAARVLFVQHGFASVSNDMISAEAGLTRGALHYHFKDKKGLFEAMCIDLGAELLDLINAQTMARAPAEIEELAVGAHIVLDFASDPRFHRPLFVEAPTVLGLEAWRKLLEPASIGLLEHALSHWVDEGLLAPDTSLTPLATLLQGALMQATLAVGQSSDRAASRKLHQEAIELLITGLMKAKPCTTKMPK